MALTTLTSENFEKMIEREGIVFIDFWADWCGPCKQYAPIFEAAATKNPDVLFCKVDTEAEQELSKALGIRSIPTTMVFRDGILLFEQSGVLPAEALTEFIKQVKELNMDEVREEIENHTHEHGDDCCDHDHDDE